MSFVEPGGPSELVEETRRLFRDTYGGEAVAIARAPGRVNLIGEHTDYNGGLVLPVALPHATYAAAAARDDRVLRIASGDDGDPWTGSIDDVGPGAVDGWAAYVGGVLWALREDGLDLPGMDVLVHGTVPLGAGLSSSAALECSVALVAYDLVGLPVDDELRHRLVAACIRAETEVAGAPTGGMDQSVSLLAVADAALLIDFGTDTSSPVPLRLPESGLTLLVTDTRVKHALVDGGYAARRADCEAAAEALGVPTLREATLEAVGGIEDERIRRRATHIVTEIARVRDVVAAVESGDWAAVGGLFATSHLSMRDDFEISCPELDLSVATAVEAGAVGARMTGGGFGGSAVAVVTTERVDAVVHAIDTAFAAAGFRAPQHLLAVPSPAASVVG